MSFSQVFDEILSVSVSCPCSNQSPQTSWLKITHPYYPIVLEITSRKWISPSQRQNLVSRAVFLLEVLGGNPSSCLFQLLEACRHSFTPGFKACNGITALGFCGQVSSSDSPCPSLSLSKTLVVMLGPPTQPRIISPSQDRELYHICEVPFAT